jgi:4-amino-4-deoxy-L-arabinose transferase-like glycosyltransferase
MTTAGGEVLTWGGSPRRRMLAWRPARSQLTVAGLAALTAAVYLWALGAGGEANGYYAAAVRSGSLSWKAFFFGSLDPGNFITVDKPPLALWVQVLAVRAFGFGTWAFLVPQALAGVGSVLILHHLVRRWMGDTAALLAALALAITPVAVLMFRYNNPDALLTFLCLAAAWALWSAVETGRTRGLVLAGALLGLAFNTKLVQAWLVVPAFALAYAVAGPPPRLGRRLGQLGAGLAALLASSFWWIAAVTVWPASARPYIGGTADNSVLDLLFGYNGIGRVAGGEGNPTAGAPGGAHGGRYGGSPGPLRLFDGVIGGQVSWLLPLAVAGLVAGLWLARGAPRTDRTRAGWLLWGGWTATCAAVFSQARGIFHPYYTVQLAPGIAALAGAGGVALWRLGRAHGRLRWALPATVALTAAWGVALLARTPGYQPALLVLVPMAAAVGLALGGARRWPPAAAALATVALLAGPAAYAVTTVDTHVTGSTPMAGPVGPRSSRPEPTAHELAPLIRFLETHRGHTRYLLATFGSQASDPVIAYTGEPVMTIGGFKGLDPVPTLPRLRRMVEDGTVRYVLVGGTTQAPLRAWVEAHGTVVDPHRYAGRTDGARALYDLRAAAISQIPTGVCWHYPGGYTVANPVNEGNAPCSCPTRSSTTSASACGGPRARCRPSSGC